MSAKKITRLDSNKILESKNAPNGKLFQKKDEKFLVKIPVPIYESKDKQAVEASKNLVKINEEYDIKLNAGISFNDGKMTTSNEKLSWVQDGDNIMLTRKPNIDRLQPAFYQIAESYDKGVFLNKKGLVLDELFTLPEDATKIILDDIERFWSRKDKYSEYNIVYKRGILMYGPPGTGKSSLINLLIHKFIEEYKGIIINVDNPYTFASFAPVIRSMEVDTPIMCILEDFDGLIDNYGSKQILNLLDGQLQIDNIIYLCTTNYLERLQARFANRPSRIDLLVEIGYPTADTRKIYFQNKLKPDDLASNNIDKWVIDTEGMTISHLKELVISVCVLGHPYDLSIKKLKSMMSISPE